MMGASLESDFVGVDVSKARLEVAFRGQAKTAQFANSEQGVAALLAALKERGPPAERPRPGSVTVVCH